MSKVVVNQLQHSTGGSAPALTWFTADGTTNQHVISTDTSGTLSWTSANPPPFQGNNVKMNFPNTITSGKSFQTDGSGNLTLKSSAAPFSTPDASEQGWRLCDRVEIATSGAVGTITLTVPSSYTTNLENIMGYRLLIKGMRNPNYNGFTTGKMKLYATYQNGSTIGNNNQAHVGYQWRRGSNGGGSSTTSGAGNLQYSNSNLLEPTYGYPAGRWYPNAYTFNSPNENNTSENSSGNEGYNGQFDFYNAKKGPMCHLWLTYQRENPTSTQMTQFITRQMYTAAGGFYEGSNIGGFKIMALSGNFVSGFMELYAVFKNGVVT